MTQEDKELLLKDLCARLPYDVKVCIKLPNHQEKIFEEQIGDLKEITRYGGYLVNSKGIDYRSFNLDIKPYLRPMSSMTEEEFIYFMGIRGKNLRFCDIQETMSEYFSYPITVVNTFNRYSRNIDWLNKNMFDYRGLIEKGLAIKVTKENNPYKN